MCVCVGSLTKSRTAPSVCFCFFSNGWMCPACSPPAPSLFLERGVPVLTVSQVFFRGAHAIEFWCSSIYLSMVVGVERRVSCVSETKRCASATMILVPGSRCVMLHIHPDMSATGCVSILRLILLGTPSFRHVGQSFHAFLYERCATTSPSPSFSGQRWTSNHGRGAILKVMLVVERQSGVLLLR